MLCAASLPLQANVVINELYYDHPSGDTGYEFLELYNNGTEAVDLSGWQVQWAGSTWTPPYGYWDFPVGTTIAPGDYLLIGGDQVETFFGEVPDLVFNFTFQNASSSGGGPTDGVRITDEVINPTTPYYDTNLYDAPNTNNLRGDDANPGQQLCPDVVNGHSLERVTLGVDNNLAADWFDNSTPTPTRSSTGIAPYINWSMNYPEIVGPFSNVQIIAEIIDDDGLIVEAIAYYSTDGLLWNQTAMTQTVGNRWAANLPQQTVGTTVQFYVYAEDDDGLSVVSPAGAPAITDSYVVEDLILSPTIAETKTWDANFYPMYLDSFFVIEGYVTVTNQFGLAGPANIQDETAGIAIYNANNFNWAGIQVGDYVRVYGWQGFYAGLTEFVDDPVTGVPDPQVYVIGAPSPVTPLVITPSDFAETLESQLVKLVNCQFLVGGNFTGGTSGFNYNVVSGGDTFVYRVDESTNLPGQPIPTGSCDLVGILSQYDSSSPYDAGFQVLPRFYSDVIVSGNQPPFIGNITQTPLIVTASDQVNIAALIYDDGSIQEAQLWYEVTTDEWVNNPMYDDGLHGDGAAGDSVYGAYIPMQLAGSTVSYYLLAIDNIGQITYQPTGGASAPYAYTVTSGALVTPIATVREVDVNNYPVNYGNLFIVKGVVTSAAQYGTSGPAYLQDATGGIAFYDGIVTTSGIAIGDSIELTAYVDFYNGLIQLADDPLNPNNDPSLTIVNSGNPIAFATITPLQLNETYEGQLVKIGGAHFVETGSFASGPTYQVVAGMDTFGLYIDGSTNLVGTPIPTGDVDIMGCVGQYDTSSPYTSGYQLLPRTVDDITPAVTISTIAAARLNDANGYPVNIDQMFTLEGVITASSQFSAPTSGGPAFMQDATGGIALFDSPVTMFGNIGDMVRVTGWVGFYNGLTQIVDHPVSGAAPTVEILSTGNTFDALEITQMNEDNEGEFVVMYNCYFVLTGSFTGNTNYQVVTALGDTIIVRVDQDTNIPGNSIPEGMVDIKGLVQQFDSSSPYFSGYQLFPRYLDDICEQIVITPISSVRANDANGYPLNIDLPFTIEGVITASGQFSASGPAYIQDASGAVGLYDSPVTMFGEIGDMVRVTGWVGFYNGVTQMVDDPITAAAPTVEILSSGNTFDPTFATGLDESIEGMFILNPLCLFLDTGTFAGNVNYNVLNSDGDTIVVRIDTDTNIPGTPIPVGMVNILGIVGQYDNSSPYLSGYQLQPRFLTDLIPAGMPIAYVRQNNLNGVPVLLDSLVSFSAIVTATNQFGAGGPAYLMDPTGGIALFDSPISQFNLEIGDIVFVQGWVGFYNGLTEIVDHPVTAVPPTVTVLANISLEEIEWPVITPDEIGEDYEGVLVTIENCRFLVTGSFSGGTSGFNYSVVSGEDTFTVRIDESVNLVGTSIPEVPVNITGCLSQFDNSSPYFSGYQLFPRFLTDIVPYSAGTYIQDLLITVQGNDVVLTWSAQPSAYNYRIYAQDTAYGAAYEIGSTANTTFTITDALLSATEKFYYVTYEY